MTNFVELTENELMDIDGGIVWIPILIAAGKCAAALGAGVAIGYGVAWLLG